MQMNAAYAAGALAIGMTITNYVVPWFFPTVTRHKKIDNVLEVKRIKVPITTGMCNLAGTFTQINASNPFTTGFMYLPDSNNAKGGAQFSYTFWLKLTSNKLSNSGKVIFMRGLYNDKGRVEGHPDEDDLLVKCPLVKFSDSVSGRGVLPYLDVEFNTLKNPHNSIVLDEEVFSLVQSSENNPMWYLVSLVFQDYVDFTNREHGVQVQVFLNDSLVKTEVIKDDSIKLNHGDFYLTPTNNVSDPDSHYGNLTYYNYALDIMEVQDIFLGRASQRSCNTSVSQANSTGFSTKYQYNRLSLYNQLGQI
jgi:hypothetical protein